MQIGIEAERANIDNPTGVEHYAQQLILHLAIIDRENRYILYLRTPPKAWFAKLPANFIVKVMPFPVAWTQIRISLEMLINPVDCLFVMASALPLIHPRNSVVTIHDLAWEFYPQTFDIFKRFYLPLTTWFAVRQAKKIIAVSKQTKNDLVVKYHIDQDKVSVVHHGIDIAAENFDISADEAKKLAALPEKFILYQGTLQPRKNIIGLIDAFIDLKKEKKIPHALVIVGAKGWLYQEIIAKIQNHPEVIYYGYAENRFEVIAKSDLMVQPAFYEGFGMGILDAFAMHKPVAAANVSSLPEVAGNAAIYFDPHDIESIKNAIDRVITDRELWQDLVAKGDQRVKAFTWEKAARETLEVLKK